jgi:CheY-like chemotaxis protein
MICFFYKVFARNGQEVLDFLYKKNQFSDVKRPNLILLDINMPVFNGHEVLQEIKTDATLKATPTIMLTTSYYENYINKALKNNTNAYIIKPIDIDQFLKVILRIQEFWLQIATLPKEDKIVCQIKSYS